MAITTLSLKYRPIKIGFLVRNGNIEDLVKAAGINTLLWGGIYNPIIPVSETNQSLVNQLLNLFSVDVLFAVAHTKEIDEIIQNNPFLSEPDHYSKNIFYEESITKKNLLGYLDSFNIVEYYWEKEFKNKPKSYKSNCTYVKWNNTDLCNDLFSISFGYFPDSYNLKDDFQNAFLKGLKSKEVYIEKNNFIDDNLAKSTNPIVATSLELNGYGGTWRGNGIYVGLENDFTDLLYFWNLRASGLLIEFLPKNHIERFGKYIKMFIKRLDNAPNRNPNIEDWINVYYSIDYKEIKDIIKDFQGSKKFCFSQCNEVIWNGSNIKPSSFYFNRQQMIASVDKDYNRYSVSFALPEKKFIISNQNRDVDFQHLAISIDSFSEFAYPGHTLKPPFIRELNEFYSREIIFDPWQVRSEQGGIGVIIRANDNSLSIHPISHHKLIERIFKLAGYKANMSQAGLLVKQIIYGMKEYDDSLEAGRIFKITGVRKLISSLKASESISWDKAIKIIGENNFYKFKKLYIESRKTQELTPADVFNYLLKKKIFTPNLINATEEKWIYKCESCGLKESININSFESLWCCPYCAHEQYMPAYIAENFKKHKNTYWQFKKGGLFSKDNNQEGAIPVIISLLTFARIFDEHKLLYSTSLNLQNSKKCEIDFCVLQYQRGDKIQLGIGECKSEGQKINQQDVNNLKAVQDEIEKINIDCYLIFSKITDAYESDEIDLFRSLKDENRKFIVLSNKELEPYHPYWEMPETEMLPEKYALDMMEMYRNSLFLYVKDDK